jgi:hypothetical protein
MNQEKFDEIVSKRLDGTKKTLCEKAKEYAHGDRLSNFNMISKLTGLRPEMVLGVLMAKHVVALFDFIKELGDLGKYEVEREYKFWDEKIGDTQAYLCILDAMRIKSHVQGLDMKPGVEAKFWDAGPCTEDAREEIANKMREALERTEYKPPLTPQAPSPSDIINQPVEAVCEWWYHLKDRTYRASCNTGPGFNESMSFPRFPGEGICPCCLRKIKLGTK